jgi:hypothetical protein
VVKKMEKYDFEALQTRTCVINNRHNHVTTMYYLLLKKQEREPKRDSMEPEVSREKRKREESPLIYWPEKKPEYYLPTKKEPRETKDSSKNDSINASNIISSLVEANKNKLLTQRFNRKPQTTNGAFEKA